jgi:hypothetical protein
VLRVLEPALRMKAQTDSNSRGRKDFICREFSWRKEKRKTAYWRMQRDPETSDPLSQVGEWGFIAYLHCLMAGDANRRKQAFPREEKCLLDHLSPFETSHSPSFSPSIVAPHIYIPRMVYKSSPSSPFSPAFVVFKLFDNGIVSGVR